MEYKELFQWNLPATVQTLSEVRTVMRDLPVKMVFEVTAGDDKELEHILNATFLPPANSFEFWTVLNLHLFDKGIIEPWLNNFTGLLCHLKYSSFANKKVIGYHTTTPNAEKIIAKIQAYLDTQGFNNIIYFPIHDEIATDELIMLKVTPGAIDNDSFYATVMAKIKQTAYPLQLFFDVIAPGKAVENINLFTGKLTNLLNQSVLDKELLLKIYQLRKALDEQENKNKTLQSTLNTNNTYVEFLKSIIYGGEDDLNGAAGSYKYSEMIKIKRFYHYEYEILPLWYKRLGHIIKVLTGKRTFKSLFNDNVKKYKV
jgi:hypothetical protein